MIQPGKIKKCSFVENLKAEKKKHRSLGNHSNNAEDTASDCPLNQLKRKFCTLFVSENCPFNKKAKTEESVDVEINSPEIEKDQASNLGIQIDDIEESPLSSFNNQLTDNLLTKKVTIRENCIPKQNYYQPSPCRWLQSKEDAARAIVPYVDAQQIILNNLSNGEWREDMVPDNVPSNDLLFDSYNYTQVPYHHQHPNHVYHNGEFYDIDDFGRERGDVEEIEDEEDLDMDMEVI